MKITTFPHSGQLVVQSVKEYGRRLFGFIRSRVNTNEDAEDILQDVWYQLSVLDAGPVEQLGAWLYKVAQNKIIDHYRKQKPEAIEDISYEDDEGEIKFKEVLLIEENNDPEIIYLKNLFWEKLFSALSELPEPQRNIFVLNELENKTFQEISDESGENIKTLISRKHYAVVYLRERLHVLYEEIVKKII
ncbi:MAG: sigma-70 family RNA polymerase sigma factor [Ignavibacteriaceae bacterium]|nr:sigma-70 family RNA polymerase sigma factor [Ignavibacteriaceae bacterium]